MVRVKKLQEQWKKLKRADLEQLRAQYPGVFYEVFHLLPQNVVIDFASAIFHPEKIAVELDALGIKSFSISGGWSGAQETIAGFEKCGFKLEGLIYVATQSDEKVPAFLLRKVGSHRIRGVNCGR